MRCHAHMTACDLCLRCWVVSRAGRRCRTSMRAPYVTPIQRFRRGARRVHRAVAPQRLFMGLSDDRNPLCKCVTQHASAVRSLLAPCIFLMQCESGHASTRPLHLKSCK